MEKSDNINELATALAKAQGAMKGAKKDSDNPFFKSKYADLASCWDAIREPFSANGLSITQLTEQSPDLMVIVETVLMHSSGQWVSSRLAMKPVKSDPQGLGSCLTYCRRYGISAACGISFLGEDDDANAATGKDVQYITDAQKSTIVDFINEKGVDESKFLAFMAVKSLETIPADSFNKAVASLKSAKGKA